MNPLLTIGSRGSQLALWQAHFVQTKLRDAGVDTDIRVIKTTGDHLQTASLTQAGGKGLFTKEIEEALLAGVIDLAVHSLKDLPTETPDGLVLAAIPEREDPRDALLGLPLADLQFKARVGTSSGRRAAQLRAVRADLLVEPVRGNVDTRIRKLEEGQFDAILLAVAGLRRLGLQTKIAEMLAPEVMCPAAGQGALAIQTRNFGEARERCRILDHMPTCQAVTAERAALSALGGGCQLPVGAYAEVTREELQLRVVVAAPDGGRCLQNVTRGPAAAAAELGLHSARDLLAQGAGAILACAS